MSALALQLVGGFALLALGGEALVRGSSRLSAALGVTPLVIGLTVVAFGTSAPEMAVSVAAALRGSGDIALGNVLGSNTFNVLCVLGLAALVAPVAVAYRLVRIDVPLMVFASVLTLVLALDGVVSRLDGLMLAACLVAYLAFSVEEGRKGATSAIEAEYDRGVVGGRAASAGGLAVQAVLVVVGLAVLVLGSRLFVAGASALARQLGVSELVIGLTVVAAGTSLPEVVASVVAALRGERDIAVGNVVGSNLFNVLGVLGLSAALAPSGVAVPDTALRFDLPVMLATSGACLPLFFIGHRIARWQGALFLAYYAAYVGVVVLRATGSATAEALSHAMLGFVLPLTVVTVAVGFVRAARQAGRPAG